MPTNPSAGKRPANASVSGHTRKDGTKVRAHSRSVNASRIKATWIGTATSGAVCAGILLEAGFTVASSLGVVLIASFTWLAVIAGGWAEKNRATMNAQTKRRRAAKRKPTQRRRTSSRTTRRR
jgi:hypothetical protein